MPLFTSRPPPGRYSAPPNSANMNEREPPIIHHAVGAPRALPVQGPGGLDRKKIRRGGVAVLQPRPRSPSLPVAASAKKRAVPEASSPEPAAIGGGHGRRARGGDAAIMGYGVSRQSVLRGEADAELSTALTPRQAQLVRSTWAVLSQDLAGTGVLVFQRYALPLSLCTSSKLCTHTVRAYPVHSLQRKQYAVQI